MKIKKLLSLVLCLSMLVSTLCFGAYAEEIDSEQNGLSSEKSIFLDDENNEETNSEPLLTTAAVAVAKVGNTEYESIDSAIDAWANGTTLTLLSDVQLSDVVKLNSTEYHILDLGIYTMTAAKSKSAISIIPKGRNKAGYALDIKADENNPGGISASGGSCIYSYNNKNNKLQDRPIIRIYGGIFTGNNAINHSSSNGTNCPQFWIYGGSFDKISTNRALLDIYGGTFNKQNWISPDNSAYTKIQGGRFYELGNNMMSNLAQNVKWIYATKKVNNFNELVYNVNVYVDRDGYYVATTNYVDFSPMEALTSVADAGSTAKTLVYSKANTEGLYYVSADVAFKNVKKGTIKLFTSASNSVATSGDFTIDITDDNADYTGNITLNGPSHSFTLVCDSDASYKGTVYPYSGYTLVKNTSISSDGIKTIVYTSEKDATPSALLDNKYYFGTLKEALDAAGDNSIVKLLANVAEDAIIPTKDNNNYNITLDLNEFEISGSVTIEEGVVATIKNGDITNTNPTNAALANSGNIIISDVDVISEGVGVLIKSGTANITGGKFISSKGFDSVSVNDNAEAQISGGIFSSNVAEYAAVGYDVVRTASYYAVIKEHFQADEISIEYKDITKKDAEGEKVYEIVVKANKDDYINELASVDLSFIFTEDAVANGDITFTVLPADKFAITEHISTVSKELEKRYMFNYNGSSAFEGTDNAITVGTITVIGYGKFSIATKEVSTNVVNATTLYDNLVDSYTANGAKDDDVYTGGLIINTDTDTFDALVGKVENDVIAVPVRDLAVTIDFPNAVVNNVIAYQDMKVVISGGDLDEDITIDLGTDARATDLDIFGKADATFVAAMDNGSYVINVTDALTLNNAYTVTVSGAGYRTARYTVTMTDNKQLNFWNNVMDEAQVVEIGKDSSIAKVTFLAGDIVKDNKINTYDLSAVVSYFGQTNNKTDYSDYAKYDLNRDGVIDSKDVAYVLVSWNN